MTNCEQGSPPRTLQWRVSLFQAFVCLTVLTLIGSHIYTSYCLYQAKAEISELHKRFGVVQVLDPEQVEAAGYELPVRHQYRYEIYRPQGRRLVIKYAFRDLRFLGPLPPTAGEVPVFVVFQDGFDDGPRAGKFIVSIALLDNNGTPQMQIRTNYNGAQIIDVPKGTFLDDYLQKRPRGGNGGSNWSHAPYGATSQSDVPIVLLSVVEGGRTGEGLVVWLDDAPPYPPRILQRHMAFH
jgi:hypothetical protein